MTGPRTNAGNATPADALGDVIRQYTAVTERLSATHEALQHEVVRLRREIETKDRELERRQRLSSLGELAAGVAHEVRNPLGAIQLYSGLLKTEFEGMDSACALIEKIEAGIRAIDGVVQDTLALVPRSHRLVPQEVRQMVENAHDASVPALARRNIALEVEYADPRVCVLADSQAIQRVLINLIVNAAEASPPKTVVRVTVSAASDGTVTLRVSDEGCGLAPEHIDRIFDPFFTTKVSGTGLGLAIAHRLVEAHGGRLRARNLEPRGAEFAITLPSGDADAPQDQADVTAREANAA